MDAITDETLKEIMLMLGFTSDDADIKSNIKNKVMAVIIFLQGAGAEINVAQLDALQKSCVAIGVNDLLEIQSGKATFSPAFMLIAKQLTR